MHNIYPEDFEGYGVPEKVKSDLLLYVNKGAMPHCDFLIAVLCNDLMGAANWAKGENLEKIVPIAEFVMGFVPTDAIGSRAKMRAWCKARQGADVLI